MYHHPHHPNPPNTTPTSPAQKTHRSGEKNTCFQFLSYIKEAHKYAGLAKK